MTHSYTEDPGMEFQWACAEMRLSFKGARIGHKAKGWIPIPFIGLASACTGTVDPGISMNGYDLCGQARRA